MDQIADRLVLFDGLCKLCNGWVRFLLKYDRAAVFTLGTMQSDKGQEILQQLGFSTRNFSTVIYIENGKIYTRSDAVIAILRRLPRPWRYLRWLTFVPRGLRDWCYERIAQNRYRLFGRYDSCPLPTAAQQKRFL